MLKQGCRVSSMDDFTRRSHTFSALKPSKTDLVQPVLLYHITSIVMLFFGARMKYWREKAGAN